MTDDGRRRRIRRTLSMRCLGCGAEVPCPSEAEWWGWLRTPEVGDFRAVHGASCGVHAVGAQVEVTESEEEGAEA